MGFLDLDEIEQESKDANIVPHPLKDKMPDSVKDTYINAIVFAGLADDNTLSDVEREYGRTCVLSLGLNADDFDEAVKTVQALNGLQKRRDFLFDMLPAFTDRTVAMYVLCDMAQAMASDGALTADACKFLDSLYRLLLKCEKNPDNPLTPADQQFLADYRPYLAPGKTADASKVVQAAAQSGFDFPVGLVTFFTPDLKTLKLEGGTRTERKYSICSGKFFLETELIIEKGTEFVLRDAEITFGPKAQLNLSGAKVIIENCTFRAAESKTLDERPDWPAMIRCSELTECEFRACTFHGGKIRTALRGSVTRLFFTDCMFDDFKVSGQETSDAVVYSASQLTCTRCHFAHCRCVDECNVIVRAESFNMIGCIFEDCSSDCDLFSWYGHNHVFRFEKCKFAHCFSSYCLVRYYESSTLCNSSDGFFSCCKLDTRYSTLIYSGYDRTVATTMINLTEEEFQDVTKEDATKK